MSPDEKDQRVHELLKSARFALYPSSENRDPYAAVTPTEPNEDQLTQALALYNQALEIEPESLGGLMGRCSTLRLLGRPEEAKADVPKILKLNPRDYDYLLLCPNFEGDELRMFITKALKAIPPGSLFRDHMRKEYIQSYWTEGNLEAVAELLSFQDEAQGLDDHERWKLGQALESLQRYEEAEKQYRQSTYNPESLVGLLIQTERFEDAIKECDKLEPELAQNLRAVALKLSGREPTETPKPDLFTRAILLAGTEEGDNLLREILASSEAWKRAIAQKLLDS